ncbi:MAG: response regulator [Kiloniellaceae bacterium]
MSARPIILAEDEEKLLRLYSEFLMSLGFTVMRATDGEKAVALAHKITRPQLIILDVMMPHMDGIEACIRIRKLQNTKPSPILFLSNLETPHCILECLRAGGDDYLVKSASMKELGARVQYWARRGPLQGHSERRLQSIRALEALLDDEDPPAVVPAQDALPSRAELLVEHLTEFILQGTIAEASGSEDILCRFGYLVGLMETKAPILGKDTEDFGRYLRTLIQRTAFIGARETDVLLKDYLNVIGEARFQKGWSRGERDAALVGLPRTAEMAAQLKKPQANA